MTTTPGSGDDSDQPAERWSGRASVSPESTRVSGRASVAPVPSASGMAGIPVSPAPASAPPPQPVYRTRKKLKPRWGRIALVSVIVVALIGTGAVLSGYF